MKINDFIFRKDIHSDRGTKGIKKPKKAKRPKK